MRYRWPFPAWHREVLQEFLRGFSMPAFLIALLWIGLWDFWPSLRVPSGEQKTFPIPLDARFQTTVSPGVYQAHVLPTLFALPSEVGFSLPITPPARPLTRRLMAPDGRSVQVDAVPSPLSAFAGTRVASGFPGQSDVLYRSLTGYRSVLRPAEERRWRVVVQLLDGLPAYEFSLPDLPPDLFNGLAAPVAMMAAIRFDARGFPQRIVLEHSSDRSTVNQAVIRHLYRGRLLNPDGEPWGRVLINWGFE